MSEHRIHFLILLSPCPPLRYTDACKIPPTLTLPLKGGGDI